MPNSPHSSLDQYISARHSTLGKVMLVLDRRFIIPRNQRPWAWKHASKIQDLLTDFRATMAKHYDGSSSPRWGHKLAHQGPPHFFGTFVFFERKNNEYEIFDGQQRITALSMLCAVLREVAFSLPSSQESTREAQFVLFGAFRQWLSASSTEPDQPRLTPNPRFCAVFNALIFGSVTEADRDRKFSELPQSVQDHVVVRNLKGSFDQIRKSIYDQINDYTLEEKVKYLNAAQTILETHFICVETIIKDEPYAFEVFECLNARGVSLSEEDKIKNELFKKSELSDHVEISNSWNQLNDNIRSQEVGEFLRRRLIALHSACKKSEIYKEVKSIEIDQTADPKVVVSQWLDDSRLHSQLERRDANLVNEKARTSLEAIFKILGVSLAVIPVLAAGKIFAHTDSEKFQTVRSTC